MAKVMARAMAGLTLMIGLLLVSACDSATDSDMNTELKSDERMIKQVAANLQKGAESVGGHLHMTDQRLVFEAHQINIQGGTTEIRLPDIQGTEKCWTQFLGIVPLAPNCLAVHTKAGNEYRFTLWGRSAWAEAIDAHKGTE